MTKLSDGQHRPRPPHNESFRLRDDGDTGYVILQCLCGCKPMALAMALPDKGVWPLDCSVVEWEGMPALRCRVEMD